MEEMRCDEFVIQRGLGKDLLQALETISHSGVVSLWRTDESALDGIRNYLRLVSGGAQPEDWHPHLEVRIREVRERVWAQR
jgi:flagellar motor component MotA